MNYQVVKVAMAVEHKPHSFDHIRGTTGLKLTNDQFVAMIGNNRDRFKLVHFVRRGKDGKPTHPSRPGVQRRTKPV
jgi:hypothetical protein